VFRLLQPAGKKTRGGIEHYQKIGIRGFQFSWGDSDFGKGLPIKGEGELGETVKKPKVGLKRSVPRMTKEVGRENVLKKTV